MNNNHVKVNLFCKPHVAKFIQYNSSCPDAFIVDSKTPSGRTISNIIRMFLCNKRKFYRQRVFEKQLHNAIDGFVEINVYVSTYMFKEIGAFISDYEHVLFNRIADGVFREKLYSHVMAAKMYSNITYIESISDFLSMYDISEDEIDIDTLVRDFQRKQKN